MTTDTIVVTHDNAANAEVSKGHYQGLPGKLAAQGINPKIPWLHGYVLDFRFR